MWLNTIANRQPVHSVACNAGYCLVFLRPESTVHALSPTLGHQHSSLMKRGFLPRTRTQQVDDNTRSAELSASQHNLPQQHEPETQQQEAAADVRQNPNWQQCLEMLRSDVDAKKFVGLLLVTKLLPQGASEAARDVLDAVGFAFLHRLLHSLKQDRHTAVDADKLQQQHLSAVLGLSILSAACRLADVAASDDVLQLVPLLLKVAAAGGVAPVLQPHITATAAAAAAAGQQDGSSWPDAASEAATVVDALECLVACASTGSYQQSVVLESNGFRASVQALQLALASLDSKAGQGDASSVEGLHQVMLPVQLLSLLLGSQPCTAQQAAVEQPEVVAAALMLLSRVLGGSVRDVPSSGSSRPPDAAALQLQAQHALLLLLPLPMLSPAAALLTQAAQDMEGGQSAPPPRTNMGIVDTAAAVSGDWPAALRQGLCGIMRSRVGAVQRHSALRLAAACFELLGPAWLLPQQQQQQPLGSDLFILVLVEVLSIETPLLLSDAMNPTAVVPREDLAMAARPAAATGGAAGTGQDTQSSGVEQQRHEDSFEEEMDTDHQQQSALSPKQVYQHIKEQEQRASGQQQESTSTKQGPPGFQQQQKGKSFQQQLADLQLPPDKSPGPGQQLAGDRAQQCLPSCYQLLEACLDILVHQVGLLEQLADIHGPDWCAAPAAAAGSSPAAAQGAARPVRISAVLPALGAPQVDQLMQRLHQVTQVICEFLEHALSPPTVQPAASIVDPLIIVGAVRVLGRFLADAPDAHADVLRKLLPMLLALQTPGEGPLSSSGVCFLLPALLSWTSRSNGSQHHWAEVLLNPSSRCVAVLAGFASEAAATAAGLASMFGPAQLSNNNRRDEVVQEVLETEAKLGTACHVLYQLLASLPTARARLQGSQLQSISTCNHQELQDALRPALAQLLPQLSSWAALRYRQQQAQQAQGRAGLPACPAAIKAAVKFLDALESVHLALPVLLPVAAVAGQLVLQLSDQSPQDVVASATTQLLCLGCEVGWEYQLLEAWKVEQGQGTAHADGLLQHLRDAWVSAELAEVWDACLSCLAEVIIEGAFGGLACAAAAAPWITDATHAAAALAVQEACEGETDRLLSPSQAVVQDSMAMQLLIKACRAHGAM